MKNFLTSFLFFTLVITLSGQDTLTIYYKKNVKPTRKIEKSEFYKKVIKNNERYYFQEFLTATNQLIQETEIKSWEPLIEDGKTSYFDLKSEKWVATGYYQNGNMSDKWIFKTKNGYDTVNYSVGEIKYLPNPSFSEQETFLIVEKMPYFDYCKDLKQKRESLDKLLIQLSETGNIQANHDRYMDLQRKIIDINKQAFDNYKAKNLIYPIRAKEREVQGIVYLQFVINEFGEIVETAILKGVDKDLDREAVRLINSMNNWTNGIQRGKPVRVAMTVGVKFEL